MFDAMGIAVHLCGNVHGRLSRRWHRLLLGIDVGTASSKGVLLRPDGSLVADARADHAIDVRVPGASGLAVVEPFQTALPALSVRRDASSTRVTVGAPPEALHVPFMTVRLSALHMRGRIRGGRQVPLVTHSNDSSSQTSRIRGTRELCRIAC